MLLGMVRNVGLQVDGKIRLQNAADAAAYSGGLELARAMNSLTFTNHLMCEIFAMTAILRKASDPKQFPQNNGQQAASHVPEILKAWNQAAELLKKSSFDKYQKLVPISKSTCRRSSNWLRFSAHGRRPSAPKCCRSSK